MTTITYRRGQEDPPLELPWLQADGTALDLSAGYTFTVQLVASGTAAVTKTTGIVGSSGAVTITWAANELNIAPGVYDLLVTATSGARDRCYAPDSPPRLRIVGPTVGGDA